jgi:hypothetical protein
MAEVLAEFPETVLSTDQTAYRAQACGAATRHGIWEGWVEFIPIDGGAPVRSPRETTQPNRVDAEYWASGLSPTYLEGALERALRRPVAKTVASPQPLFDAPAPGFVNVDVRETRVHAVLDPFSVYTKGEALLRQELSALSAWHLVNILLAYELTDESESVLNDLPQATLIDLIVTEVREQTPAK